MTPANRRTWSFWIVVYAAATLVWALVRARIEVP
jgi:hypothetical protein